MSSNKKSPAGWSQLLLKVIVLTLLFTSSALAQVGINTTDPKGSLDVTSINNTGLVLPRVTAIEDVTDGNGNPPVDGTTVYDLSRNSTCFYQNSSWICIGIDGSGNPVLTDQTPTTPVYDSSSGIDYVKSSVTNSYDYFGWYLAISADGNTLAISKLGDDSNSTGVGGNPANTSATESGAVFVFERTGTTWTQQAYIKASNTDVSDYFGYSIALSKDGNTLAVTAFREDSNATGIDGTQMNNSSTDSGAVYVYTRTGSSWSQQAYIKASNTDVNDQLGHLSVALSTNGDTLAVSAIFEDSNATGLDGNESDNTQFASGAIYVFSRSGVTWTQQAYIKSSNSENNDEFGASLAFSGDGNTLAIASYKESSDAAGINGNQSSNLAPQSGAVYIFTRTGTTWTQQAYIKASNPQMNDSFGISVAISESGDTLAVGAIGEDSNAVGINNNQSDNSSTDSGAVYIFTRTGITWSQQAYIKASNTQDIDLFGNGVSLSNDGNLLAVSAIEEDSGAVGINGDQTDNSIAGSGAAYLFTRSGSTWSQQAYVKASNTGLDPFVPLGENFGFRIALAGNGFTLAVSAVFEDSQATGLNGDQTDNSAQDSGAVYVYTVN